MTVTTAHMSKLALPFRSSRDVGGGVYASQRMTQDNFHEWGDERCLSQALSQVRINTGSPAVHEDAYENINPTPPPSLFDNPCPPKGEIRFTAGGGILRVEQTPAQRSCDLLQPPTTGSLHQQPIMESREDVAEDVQHRWPYEGYGSQAEVLCTPDFITPVDQQFSAEGNSLQGAPHRLRSPVRLTPVRVKRPRQATFAMSLSSSQVSSQGGAGGGGDSACSSDMSLGGGGGPASQRSHESAPACRPPLRSLDPNATPGFPYGRGPIKGAVPPTPARRSSACGGAQGSLSHRLQMAGPQPGAVEPPAVRPGGYRIEELMGSQGESSSQSQSVSIGDVIRSAIPRGGGASRGGEAEEEDPVGPVGATAAAGAAIAGRGTSEAGAACSGEARRLGSVGTAHAHAPPQPRMPPNSKSRVLAARGRAPRSPPCQPNPFLVVTRGATAGSSDAVMADGGGAEAAGGVGSGTGNGSSGQAAGGNDAAVGALPRPGSGSYRPLNLVSSLSGAPMSRYREMFKEVKEMGRGSFGKVMEVRHRLDGCLYAVKYSIHPLLDDSVRRRAMLEVQALAAIDAHPNIVRYYTSWMENDRLYIQLERCDKSLDQLAKSLTSSGGSFPEAQLLSILRQVACALHALHSAGMAHMDVKPDNIYIKGADTYKLGDLGRAARMDGSVPGDDGDARYLPQELLNDDFSALDRADIFSLGASLYELARGAPLPSSGAQFQALRQGRLMLLPAYSTAFMGLLRAMLSADPRQRPSAAELLRCKALQ